jgi:hypothetical protein
MHLRLNVGASGESTRESGDLSAFAQMRNTGLRLSNSFSASMGGGLHLSLRGSTSGGDWQGKLRLSLSLDLGRKSFEVSSNGTLRLADGFELNARGFRAPRLPSAAAPARCDATIESLGLDLTRADSVSGAPFLDEGGAEDGAPDDACEWEVGSADFIMLRILGRGASATVHLALHIPSLTIVALKMISVYEESKRHQMAKELKALVEVGQLSPSFVNFLGAYFQEGSVVFALEYMNRGSLQDYIDQHGALPVDVVVRAARQLTLGLHALHERQLSHRDIKPANILVDHQSNCKLADFGILGTARDDYMHTFVGTQIYMRCAPEYRLRSPSLFVCDLLLCWFHKFTILFLMRRRVTTVPSDCKVDHTRLSPTYGRSV